MQVNIQGFRSLSEMECIWKGVVKCESLKVSSAGRVCVCESMVTGSGGNGGRSLEGLGTTAQVAGGVRGVTGGAWNTYTVHCAYRVRDNAPLHHSQTDARREKRKEEIYQNYLHDESFQSDYIHTRRKDW